MLVLVTSCFTFMVFVFTFWPLVKKKSKNEQHNVRQKINSQLYQQQIKALSGLIPDSDPEKEAQLKEELALCFLVNEHKTNSLRVNFDRSIIIPVIMTVFILLICSMGYLYKGNYKLIDKPKDQPLQEKLIDSNDKDEKLLKLYEKIRANPQDSENWFILLEYYLYNDQFEKALMVLDKIRELKGDVNEVRSVEAMILYYLNGQRITPQVKQLLDKILETEPLHISALMLIASDHYYQGQYQEAIDVWQKLLDSGYSNIDRAMLIERINTARMMLNLRN